MKNETCHNMNDESRVLSEFVKENKLKALDRKAHEVLMNYKSPTDAAYDPRCKIVCNTDVSNLFCLTLRGHEVDIYNKSPEIICDGSPTFLKNLNLGATARRRRDLKTQLKRLVHTSITIEEFGRYDESFTLITACFNGKGKLVA